MAYPNDRRPPVRPAVHQSVTRCVIALVLALVEGVVLSVWFDTKDVRGREWWLLILRFFPVLIQSVIATIAIAVIFSWGGIRRVLENRMPRSGMALPMFLHAICLGGFTALTWLLLQQEWQIAETGPFLVLGWLGAGGLCLFTLFQIAIGRGLRSDTIRQLMTGLIIALPVGVAAAWLGHQALQSWQLLSGPTLWSVQRLLGLLGCPPEVYPQQKTASLGSFTVHIADSCSGYQGMGIIVCVVLATVLTQWKRLRFPQVLLLFPLAMAISWVLNILRVSGLLLLGAYVSPEIALGGFHSQAGWVAMTFVSLGVVWLALRTKFFSRETPKLLPFRKAPVAAHLVPFLVWLIVGMISTSLVSPSHLIDVTYPLRVVAAILAIAFWWSIRPVRFHGFPVAATLGGLFTLGIWVGLELAFHGEPADLIPLSIRLESLGNWGIGWMIVRAIGSCLVVPWLEESVFRGYLMRRLAAGEFEKRGIGESPWWAWILSSVLFGLFHHQRMIAGMCAGLVYGYLARRRGQLSDAVVAHGVTNAGLTILAVFTDQAGWWS